MHRVFTYAEQVASYPWPKGSEETRKYFEALGQDKIDALSDHFRTQEQKPLPLANIIAAALFLEDALSRSLKPASLGEMVAARKIDAIDACSFYILPSIPLNLDNLRGSYLWILSPEHIKLFSTIKVYDITIILQALEQLFIRSNKSLNFINIDGKIELVPIREPKNFAITFLNVIYADAAFLKSFSLEKLKDFHVRSQCHSQSRSFAV